MSSRLAAKKLFQNYQLVASEVGVIEPFLKKTSCMSPTKRFEVAACEIFRLYFCEDKEFNEFLEKKIEPSLITLGHAEWNRDILTDLGLKVSKGNLEASLKALNK